MSGYKIKKILDCKITEHLDDGFTYDKDDKTYWYSAKLEANFHLPEIHPYVHASYNLGKIYYKDTHENLVVYDPVKEDVEILIPAVQGYIEPTFAGNYMNISNEYFANVKTNKVWVNKDLNEFLLYEGHGRIVVMKFTDIKNTSGTGVFSYTYEISGYYLHSEECIFTITESSTKQFPYADLKRVTKYTFDMVKTTFNINGNMLYVNGSVYKIKERTEKPRCLVCKGKLKNIGIILPCEHKQFHYDCIGDTCPKCKGPVDKKIVV